MGNISNNILILSLVIAGLLTIGVWIYGMVRSYLQNKQKRKLSALVNKKTAKISQQRKELELKAKRLLAEQKRSENLLKLIFPGKIAEQLIEGVKPTPQSYPSASVMYADFKSFSKLANQLDPGKLLQTLDYYFTGFDNILTSFNIEKIKTIGDCYMCVGGLPEESPYHAAEIVLAGLKFQEFMANSKNTRPDLPVLQLRIGIDSGECVAGIIGSRTFAFDIWGKTVNFAHEIESSGAVDRVNISSYTYKHIKSLFNFTDRGIIETPKGNQSQMYFVDSILEPLSKDGKGIEPNALFWEYLEVQKTTSIKFYEFESHILQFLSDVLEDNLYYHGVHHAKAVEQAAEKIAWEEGIRGEELYCLKAAALLHDVGYMKKYEENEEIGASIAEEILPQFGFNSEQIKMVSDLIKATRVPQNPQNRLQEILCDADLLYLGENNFEETSKHLMQELKEREYIKSEKEWDEMQVAFISKHSYYTQYARDKAEGPKQEHLVVIKERVAHY